MDNYDFGFEVVTLDMLNVVMSEQNERIKGVYHEIKQIIPKLHSLGFSADIVPLPFSDRDGCYWSHYAKTFLEHKNSNFFDQPFLYFVFKLDSSGKTLALEKDILIHFSKMNKETKVSVLQVFYDHFPQSYYWTGSNNVAMIVKYYESDATPINVSSLKDDDTYPRLTVYITMQRKDVHERLPHLKIVKELKELSGDLEAHCDHNYCRGINYYFNGVAKDKVIDMADDVLEICSRYKGKGVYIDQRIKKFSVDWSCFYDSNNDFVNFSFPLNEKNKIDFYNLPI